MNTIRSPIELSTTSQQNAKPCSNKCSYKFDYEVSDCVVTNKTNYLLLSYNNNASTVTFNGSQCLVQEIRLYSPSLNNYYGSKTDAELIINHTINGGNNLLVCVPISVSSTNSISSSLFEPIIKLAPINASDDPVNVNVQNYTLNNLIPTGPFFNYTGTLPYDDNNGTYNVVIFDKQHDSNVITIQQSSLDTLRAIIEPLEIQDTNIDEASIYYNENGTTSNPTSDDIYIDCQLVDSDGNVVVDDETGEVANVSGSKQSLGEYFKDIVENPWAEGFLIILVAAMVIYGARKVMNK